jgi:hypothetical protein
MAVGTAGIASADLVQQKADKDAASLLPPGQQTSLVLDCSGATAIACGGAAAGDNTGAVNNVTLYSCAPYNESGGEVVYVLTLGSESIVNVVLNINTAADLDLFLLGSCDESNCITASAGITNIESLSSCLQPGTYYIVVDGYNGAASSFSVSVTCTKAVCPPAGAETCGDAPDLCGDVNFETSTLGHVNDYDPGVGNTCTGYSASGPDIVYRLQIAPGGSVNLVFTELTYDASVYIVTDCNDPAGSCLVGSDCFPGVCDNFLDYTNTTGDCLVAYLIIDGFGGGSGVGQLSGSIDCCPPTANELSTWGQVKGLYR